MCSLMYLHPQKTEFVITSISKSDQPSENVYVAPHTEGKTLLVVLDEGVSFHINK